MTPRIGRRYDALVRFLKETIANEKIGHRVRMQAAMRLSEIYLQHDAAKERRELAELKASAKSEAATAASAPALPSVLESQPDPERAAKEFLERMRTIDEQF